jgi:predicted cupin superfamily sugar epimerase
MERKSVSDYNENEHELQHHSQYYNKNPNYHSLIVNDDKNPSLLITKEEIIGKYFLHHHPVLQSFYCSNSSEPSTAAPLPANQLSTNENPSFSSSLSTSAGVSVPFSISYYYLLDGKRYASFIPFHRLLAADQTFHFYFGKPIILIELGMYNCHYHEVILGNNIMKNEVVSYTVKAGTWFGSYSLSDEEISSDRQGFASSVSQEARNIGTESSSLNSLINPESFCYSFLGGTVAPGIDYTCKENIEVGSSERLLKDYPDAKQFIEMLTNKEI